MLYVRNPWGNTGGWNGPWCADYHLWNEDTKAAVNYKEEPGTFYITVEDFVANFSRTNICKIVDDIIT